MVAENLFECRLEKVRCRVVSLYSRSPYRINFCRNLVADLYRAFFNRTEVQKSSVQLLCIGNQYFAAVVQNNAAVTDLTAAFGIERRSVKDYRNGVADPYAVLQLAV